MKIIKIQHADTRRYDIFTVYDYKIRVCVTTRVRNRLMSIMGYVLPDYRTSIRGIWTVLILAGLSNVYRHVMVDEN